MVYQTMVYQKNKNSKPVTLEYKTNNDNNNLQ